VQIVEGFAAGFARITLHQAIAILEVTGFFDFSTAGGTIQLAFPSRES
jgi:hypothetical protein